MFGILPDTCIQREHKQTEYFVFFLQGQNCVRIAVLSIWWNVRTSHIHRLRIYARISITRTRHRTQLWWMTLLPIWKLSLCTNRESQWVPVKSSSLHGARCSMFGAAGEHETHCENWEICLWFSRWRRKTGLWKTVGMFWLLRVTKGEPSTTCTRWMMMMTMSIIFNSQNDIVIWIVCIFLCVVVCDTTIHTTSTRTFHIRGTVFAEPQTGFDGWSPDGVWWYRQWLKCYVGYSLKPNWVNRARAVQHGLDNDYAELCNGI